MAYLQPAVHVKFYQSVLYSWDLSPDVSTANDTLVRNGGFVVLRRFQRRIHH